MVSGFLLLPVSLMASQAMESITRAFYTRSDLELILSSPAPATRLFAVRMLAIAHFHNLSDIACHCSRNQHAGAHGQSRLALRLSGHFCLWSHGHQFCHCAYHGTFQRYRAVQNKTVAQIVAAVVGAGFVIGIQLVAIISIGSMSRLQFLQSEFLVAQSAPGVASAWWSPALGAMGNGAASR